MVGRSHANAAENVSADAVGPHVTCIWQGPTVLGECPLWDSRRQRLFWIDSLGQKIWSAKAYGSNPRSWSVPDVIGSIGLCEDDRFIAGFRQGFGLVHLGDTAGVVEWIGDPDPDQSDTRLNDGKVDRHGRFWCGTMNMNFAAPNAALFRLDNDLSWHRIDDGFTVSNGIAFSPDGREMYFSDSRVDRSYRYELDPKNRSVAVRRPFVETTAYEGRIDGATVDADGDYWGALFNGGAVARFSPDGRLVGLVPLPVSCPTMCSFGGPGMDVLYVTSATFLLSDERRMEEPLAGGLFAIQGLGVRGIEEPRFAIRKPQETPGHNPV